MAMDGLVPKGTIGPDPPGHVPLVGEAPELTRDGGIFPENDAQINLMTNAQIFTLMQYYNDNMYILRDDNLAVRRSKVRMWISA